MERSLETCRKPRKRPCTRRVLSRSNMLTSAHSPFDFTRRTKTWNGSRSLNIFRKLPTAFGSARNSRASRTRRLLLRIDLGCVSTRASKRIGSGFCWLKWARNTSWSRSGICTILLKKELMSRYAIFSAKTFRPLWRRGQKKCLLLCNHSPSSLRQKRRRRISPLQITHLQKPPLLTSRATSSQRI